MAATDAVCEGSGRLILGSGTQSATKKNVKVVQCPACGGKKEGVWYFQPLDTKTHRVKKHEAGQVKAGNGSYRQQRPMGIRLF